MSNKLKFVLILAALYLLLVVLFGTVGAVLWADMDPRERDAALAILQNRYGLAVFAILAGWVIIGFIVHALYRAYVLAPLRLREQALVIVNSNPGLRLQAMGAPEIKGLVKVVNALAAQRESLERDVEERIRAARASVEAEKNRLAALMSELSQSVVVCNLDGRILLYNNRARLQFQALGEGFQPSSGRGLMGLGRSIFAILDRHLITHALDNIQHRLRRGSAQPVANFVTTSQTDQLIRVQMAPVLGRQRTEAGEAKGEPLLDGYVLILDNITRSFAVESQRDQMLQSLTEGSRASLANIRAAVENLLDYSDMENEERERFIGVIRDEVGVMGRRLDRTVTEFADALKARWPLEDMLGVDLVQSAQRRVAQKVGIPTKVEEVAEGLWVRVDSFSLLQALTYLVFRLREEYKIREVTFRLAAEGRLAHLDLIWSGALIDSQTLSTWEADPMNVGGEVSPLTLREVIERHGGEIWLEREKASHSSFFRLLIPVATPQEAPEEGSFPLGRESRPEYYDFDLFRQTEESRALDDRLLTQLTFTVFDTETTGLQPSAGDEIIQIGATRIVNARLLRNETFEQLVDPRRPLVRESVQIHGITEDLLRGQPTIDKVLPFFHGFCEETVLVGHNVAFDMRFLQVKEEATGVHFRQPVLDTLLLSAVIHPNQESHQLEAIAERLGVNVIGRHTALGDAIVTGEVFLKMIPLLAQQGINTLREAREAAERTYYARIKY